MTARLGSYNELNQTDMNRRMANVIRLGTVAELDDANARVRVQADEFMTDWLPWITMRAGPDRTWWAPEPGEQVVVLCPSGEMNQGIVLAAVYQDKHPQPEDTREKSRWEWKDSSYIQYNRENHHYIMDIHADGEILLRIGQSSIRMVKDHIWIQSPRIDLN